MSPSTVTDPYRGSPSCPTGAPHRGRLDNTRLARVAYPGSRDADEILIVAALPLLVASAYAEGNVDVTGVRALSAVAADYCLRPRDYGVSVSRTGDVRGGIEASAMLRMLVKLGVSASQTVDFDLGLYIFDDTGHARMFHWAAVDVPVQVQSVRMTR